MNPGSRTPLTAREGRQAGPGQEGDFRSVNARPSAGTPSPCPLAWAWLKVRTVELEDSKERLSCGNKALPYQDPESRPEPRPCMLRVLVVIFILVQEANCNHIGCIYTFMGDC